MLFSREPLRPFRFKVPQKTFKIGSVVFGGEPGERPTVLVGSIFYLGDKLVINHDEGVFDKEKTKEAIKYAEEVAEKYSLPLAIDLVAYSEKAMENYVPFVAEVTEAPIFLDGVEEKARIAAYKISHEIGITERVIGNAIYTHSKENELNALKEYKIRNVVLMAFDVANPMKSMMPKDRLEILKNQLIPKAEEAQVEQPLVDVVVLDPASIAISAASVLKIKEETGLPVGCAPANALGPITKAAFGVEGMSGIHGGTAVFLQMFGTDFIFYGPIRRIKYVAPAVAVADAYLAYLAKFEGKRPPKKHPFNTLLRKLQRMFTGIEVWQPK